MDFELSRLTIITSCSTNSMIEYDFEMEVTRICAQYFDWAHWAAAAHLFPQVRFQQLQELLSRYNSVHLYKPWLGLSPMRQLEGTQIILNTLATHRSKRVMITTLDAEATILRMKRMVKGGLLPPEDVVVNFLTYYKGELVSYANHMVLEDGDSNFDSPVPDDAFWWRGEELFA